MRGYISNPLDLNLALTLPSTLRDTKKVDISKKTNPSHTHTNITLSPARMHPQHNQTCIWKCLELTLRCDWLRINGGVEFEAMDFIIFSQDFNHCLLLT